MKREAEEAAAKVKSETAEPVAKVEPEKPAPAIYTTSLNSDPPKMDKFLWRVHPWRRDLRGSRWQLSKMAARRQVKYHMRD